VKDSLILKVISLVFIFSSINTADSNLTDEIVLKDETQQSLMKQDKIIGCDDTLKIDELKCSKERTPEDRDRDIDEIKAQLSEILKQLAQLKQEKDIKTKDTKLNTIKKSIKKLTIEAEKTTQPQVYHKPKKIKVVETKDDYIVVEVQSGESLSKYAQKYYGDARKYYKIYKANKDKISPDLQIYIGDRLIIPTTDSYQYQEPIQNINNAETIEEMENLETIEPIDTNTKNINTPEKVKTTIIEENKSTITKSTPAEIKESVSNTKLIDTLNKAIYVDE